MDKMERLLEAMDDCGEAAVFYKGKNILIANRLFSELFGIEREKCKGMPIIDILHEESIEMITDFIRRRAHGDTTLPAAYTADFRTESEHRLPLQLTVMKMSATDGALLVVLKKG
jgi:PAS domain S-box-containing protein